MKVYRQGEHDALCGIYAIINAFSRCGIKQPPKKIYDTAVRSLIASNMTCELINGMGLETEERMLQDCLALYARALSVKRPFHGATLAKTEDEFWLRLKACFKSEGAQVVVQGIRKPSDHWVALTLGQRGKVSVFDSDPELCRQWTLKAGHTIKALSAREDEWKIEQAETLVIYRR
ncbi:hypothetical protein [Caulobacter sp. DWR1-3-2b1]|uniref:hypothetical protein n=1 Tax=Caulobacter sp. DWR1-3-2b1 TaxID=2804670 RepID=UPI003CE7CB88